MARKSARGTKQLGVDLDESLVDELEAFRSRRRETKREVVEQALRRHFDNPPAIQPLPTLPPAAGDASANIPTQPAEPPKKPRKK